MTAHKNKTWRIKYRLDPTRPYRTQFVWWGCRRDAERRARGLLAYLRNIQGHRLASVIINGEDIAPKKGK